MGQLLEITEAPKTIESSTITILIPYIQENVSTQEREDDVIVSSGDESPVTYIFFPSSSPAGQANYEEIVVSRPDQRQRLRILQRVICLFTWPLLWTWPPLPGYRTLTGRPMWRMNKREDLSLILISLRDPGISDTQKKIL